MPQMQGAPLRTSGRQ